MIPHWIPVCLLALIATVIPHWFAVLSQVAAIDCEGFNRGLCCDTIGRGGNRCAYISSDLPVVSATVVAQTSWSLVGRFLTDKIIKAEMMKQIMASVLCPLRGVQITEVLPNLFLFVFFHETDMQRVLDDGPWSFENSTLVCKLLRDSEHPTQVLLKSLDMWVHVHDLPLGYCTDVVLEQVGYFLGSVVKLDERNFSSP